MSWVNDLASSVGIPAGAATLAMAMYAACSAAERAARPEALREIGRVLQDPSWQGSVRPSEIIERVFVWTFGERHLSWKCLRRSAVATVLFMVVVCFAFGSVVNNAFVMLGSLSDSGERILGVSIGILLTFFFSGLLPDYLALWKTRHLLNMRRRHEHTAIVIPLLDFLLSIAVSLLCTVLMWETFFFLGSVAGIHMSATGPAIRFDDDPRGAFLEVLKRSNSIGNWEAILSTGARGMVGALTGHAESIRELLIISTLFTSVWTILILLSTTALKLLSPIHRFTAWFFDVEKHPVRAIGIVAGALVMTGSLVWTVVRAAI